MKQFKVLQGRIYGVPTGEIVNLTEEKAADYGPDYVEEVTDIADLDIVDATEEGEIVNLTEEKQTISPTNKQIKTSPKNK